MGTPGHNETGKGQAHPLTLAAAFGQTPGPRGARESLLLFLKGVCMGSADIVPGVSGGTIALITGIYSQLLEAIQSINGQACRALLSLDLKGVVGGVHLRFLLILLSGIGLALVSLARVMHYLLAQQPVPTWAFFLGLVAASLIILGGRIRGWLGSGGVFFLLGTLGAFYLVAMIPVSTPESLWFIFLSGAIAICAMILPGISGSFLLLIIGKYQFITSALRDPFVGEHLVILLVFAAGCLVGILSFSRLLNVMLYRFHNATMSLLAGLVCGSLRKVWPWKEVLETVSIGGKTLVLRDRNILPRQLDGEFWLSCALCAVGFFFVLALHYWAEKKGDGSNRKMKKEESRTVVRTIKIENSLAAEQVAGFLRTLADELEGKNEGGLQQYGLELHDFNKIKLGLRRGEAGELFLKIKVRDSQVRQRHAAGMEKTKKGGDEEDPGRMEYRILKKRLKANFAALGKAINAQELPERHIVQAFLQDSRRMTAWPGFGDPFYQEYNRLCTAFEEASNEKDPTRLAECFHNLTLCVKSCHARYK